MLSMVAARGIIKLKYEPNVIVKQDVIATITVMESGSGDLQLALEIDLSRREKLG
jgi:hypothetical protein